MRGSLKWLVLALSVLGIIQSAAASTCNEKSQKRSFVEISKQFLGQSIYVQAVPEIPDQMMTEACFEVTTASNPERVIAVYTAGIDEVCTMMSPLTRQSSMSACLHY